MDLRHLAVICHYASEKAREFGSPYDAALVTALDTTSELATVYAMHPDGGTTFPIEVEFEKLAESLR